MQIVRRPLLPAEIAIVSLTLAVIQFRLRRPPLASGRVEAVLVCTSFLEKMDRALDSIWVKLPTAFRHRIQPFRNNAQAVRLRLGATPNPDMVLVDHLDRLQECLVGLGQALNEHMSSPVAEVA